MNRFVLDASVVVKWVIAEPLHEQARKYRSKHITLLAPSLLLTECASAIQKKVWRGEINNVDGWQFYEILSYYERVVYTPDYLLIPHAYQIAVQLTHPVYDCLYLALSERENARMVTADRKLYNRVMMRCFSQRVAWMEDPPEIV